MGVTFTPLPTRPCLRNGEADSLRTVRERCTPIPDPSPLNRGKGHSPVVHMRFPLPGSATEGEKCGCGFGPDYFPV